MKKMRKMLARKIFEEKKTGKLTGRNTIKMNDF